MLQNAYFLAKIGANTAENEQHFAEILPILGPTTAEWWVRVATHPDRVRKTAFAVYRTVALPRADRVRS